MKENHYARLTAMTALSFVAMYALMYAMVDSFGNVFNSLNQVYMAGLMAAPMVPLELWLMRAMYRDRRMNAAFAIGAVALGVGCFMGIRQQTAISDRQFLRSMIPHHAGAILMCEEASLQDSRIKTLCEEILVSQKAEISVMKALLDTSPGTR
jgi:uncharacterized protein (DUF305 family)